MRPLARSMCRLLCALLILPAAACGGETEIQLQVDKETISAGGIDTATITATALIGGDPAKAGTMISFETTAGSFDSASALTSLSKACDGAGRAEVKLWSGLAQGSATVTASFSDSVSGASATSSRSIKFGPPSGTNTPVDGKFRMVCDAVNIGALREPIPDILVTCTLSAQTRSGEAIKASALSPQFLSEAGSLTTKDDYYTGERIVVYSPKGGSSTPKDVPADPKLAEPTYNDKNGKERNPRDGLVTLVAIIDGEEEFSDLNGNGKYDQGEPFVDAAEPFVDLNDNDQWDSDEKYLDVNGNKRWDAANGKWDASTKIMAIYKLLWTGPADHSPKTSRIDRQKNDIQQGGKSGLTAYALDINMNPVAAFTKNSDYLEWTLSSNGDAITNDALTPPIDNALGFSFDKSASSERKRWKLLSNSFTPPTHKLTVQDYDPTDTSPPSSYSVTVTLHTTPGPSGDGAFLTQLTETLADKVEGTCD
jgi:hypothetical protein